MKERKKHHQIKEGSEKRDGGRFWGIGGQSRGREGGSGVLGVREERGREVLGLGVSG